MTNDPDNARRARDYHTVKSTSVRLDGGLHDWYTRSRARVLGYRSAHALMIAALRKFRDDTEARKDAAA